MRFKRINLKWFKSIITLLIIVAILNFFKNMNVYMIASILMITVIVLALQFSMNESERYNELMTPKPLEIHHFPRKRKRFSRLKLSELRAMDPFEFERYVACILRALGYSDAYATQGTSDGGKDVIFTDSKTNKKCYCECKRYGANTVIGRPILQKLVGAALADDAIPHSIITTGRFTNECLEEAKKTGVKCIGPIELLQMIEEAEEIEKEREQAENKLEESELNAST
ncbi:restriction endonuclease [Turicibacter sp.]|uniref:restriction endonuclease n=1 Tax=Turicibacter sp. TaxID=2049042 RepID=UPI001B518CDF|nr:restriction endonuclease [Turicibacter sp.]MBP3903572.1 restriction endonuclease [Turicibacter sp.]MBP3908085.1 restriction endonuclease [Turicibacter sp.]